MKIGFNSYSISFKGTDNRAKIKAQNEERRNFYRLQKQLLADSFASSIQGEGHNSPNTPNNKVFDPVKREQEILKKSKEFQARQRQAQEAKERRAEARKRNALSKPERDALRAEEKRVRDERKAERARTLELEKEAKQKKIATKQSAKDKPKVESDNPKTQKLTVKDRYKDKLKIVTVIDERDGSVHLKSVTPIERDGKIVHLNLNLDSDQIKKLNRVLPKGLLAEMESRAKDRGYIFHIVQSGSKVFSAMTLLDGSMCMSGEFGQKDIERCIWNRASMVGLYKSEEPDEDAD